MKGCKIHERKTKENYKEKLRKKYFWIINKIYNKKMKSKIENQFIQAIEKSIKHCIYDNAIFLCKRLLEVTQKESTVNRIVPFLIS